MTFRFSTFSLAALTNLSAVTNLRFVTAACSLFDFGEPVKQDLRPRAPLRFVRSHFIEESEVVLYCAKDRAKGRAA